MVMDRRNLQNIFKPMDWTSRLETFFRGQAAARRDFWQQVLTFICCNHKISVAEAYSLHFDRPGTENNHNVNK